MLSNARVGDKLYDRWTGKYTEITSITLSMDYPIRLQATSSDCISCTLQGRSKLHHRYPRYLWDSVEEPDYPKKPIVKIKREGWINIYKHDRSSSYVYPNYDQAYHGRMRGSKYSTTIKIEWDEFL